jgi:hypothetical protein
MKPNGTGSPTPEILVEGIARQLGQDAVEKAKEQAAEMIAWEKLRREKVNQSESAGLKARYACCMERRKELRDILRLAPSGDIAGLRGRRWYYGILASVLVIAGIFFAHLTLAPFGLGPEAWLFSAGLGLVAAFWTDRTLEKLSSETVICSVCVVALLGSLGGLLVMALLRGDILALYLQSAFADGSRVQSAGSAADFYRQAVPKLQLLMALLAVAMELASGMAVFEARNLDLSSLERAERAGRELQEIEAEMVGVIGRVTHLENDAAINEAQVYRDFYLGMLERIKKNGLTHLMLIVGLWCSLGLSPSVRAQGNVSVGNSGAAPVSNVVIAVDFTGSVAGKGYDGKTDYEKNIDGACRLISQLPPGAHITVLAITDHSFSQPYVLLEGALPRDKGPLQFQDRIAMARAQIATELRRASESSPPKFPHTDMFGALIVTADILRQSSGRKVLVMFSDMRQSTRELDLERPATIAIVQALRIADQQRLVADLQGVDVYVLGVDASGKAIGYWDSLRDFWAAYFKKAGAVLKVYSILRDSPDLAQLK